MRAVYATVLYQVYKENPSLSEDWETICEEYRIIAMSSPNALAKVKSATYDPFVEHGKDSEIYGDDLLHIIGQELEAWQWMHDYYEKAGNRRATCMTALAVLQEQVHPDSEKLQESAYIRQLDSILTSGNRPILEGSGSVSHAQALDKASTEYRKYQNNTLSPVEEAYLATVKETAKLLKKKTK